MAKVLLVGQAPSRSGGKEHAFDGESGRRLARYLELGGLPALFEHFDTVNVFSRWPGKHGGSYAYRDKGDRFPMGPARRAAKKIEKMFGAYPVVVFAGSRVAEAFRCGGERGWCIFDFFWRPDGGLGLVIPHPSGCNQIWNRPEVVWCARATVHDAIKIARARLDCPRVFATGTGSSLIDAARGRW